MTERFRVLVLDDDKDILDLVHLTLSPHYEVLTLNDSVSACEILEVFEPDIVILDIMMPKVTGFQVVEFMRQNPKYNNVLIIILSAKDTTLDIKYGYKVGAQLYLTKPFQPERLLKNIQNMFERIPHKPGKKTYSMRDVTLRMQLKAGHYVPLHDTLANQTPIPDAPPPPKFKRPLGQEAEEQEGKKWVD